MHTDNIPKISTQKISVLRKIIDKEIVLIFSKTAYMWGVDIRNVVHLSNSIGLLFSDDTSIQLHYNFIKLDTNYGHNQLDIREYDYFNKLSDESFKVSVKELKFNIRKITILGRNDKYFNTENILLLESEDSKLLIHCDDEFLGCYIKFNQSNIDEYLSAVVDYEWQDYLTIDENADKQEEWESGQGEKLYKIKHIIE